MRFTVSVSQLGMVFLHLCFASLINWRLKNFFSQVEKFETDLVRCFAHDRLLCVYVCDLPTAPCLWQTATRACLLIDVIHSVRIFAVDASAILQMKTFGHLGLGTQGHVGINVRKLFFD
jgi:hypothetical protein